MKPWPTFAAVVAGVSAGYVAWSCFRGKHGALKRMLWPVSRTVCTICGKPADVKESERFLRGSLLGVK